MKLTRGRRQAFWAAVIAAMGLVVGWFAGPKPRAWFPSWQGIPFKSAADSSSIPQSIVQPTPLGTDSSVSAQPLVLHLVRTSLGRNSREGNADIGVDPRTPQTYQGGALLANGARLDEIFSDHVVLTSGDRSTVLYLDGRNPAGYTRALAVESENRSLLTVGGEPAPAVAEADSHEILTDFIRVTPVFDGERVRALEVYANTQSSEVFEAIGLEPGDRITAIDDEPIVDAASGIASLRHLTTGQAMVVRLERNGESKSVSLDGAVVVNARASLN